jgi:hypothetical protein
MLLTSVALFFTTGTDARASRVMLLRSRTASLPLRAAEDVRAMLTRPGLLVPAVVLLVLTDFAVEISKLEVWFTFDVSRHSLVAWNVTMLLAVPCLQVCVVVPMKAHSLNIMSG